MAQIRKLQSYIFYMLTQKGSRHNTSPHKYIISYHRTQRLANIINFRQIWQPFLLTGHIPTPRPPPPPLPLHRHGAVEKGDSRLPTPHIVCAGATARERFYLSCFFTIWFCYHSRLFPEKKRGGVNDSGRGLRVTYFFEVWFTVHFELHFSWSVKRIQTVIIIF